MSNDQGAMDLGEENTNKAVTFTSADSDRTLIASVEKELATQKYQNFSELCKQALRQFFLLSQPAQSISKSVLLEEQFTKLHLKLTDLEQKVSTQDTSQWGKIENILHQLDRPPELAEQQLTEMYLKFADLEQKLLDRDTHRWEKIENLLHKLTQSPKVEQTEPHLSEMCLKFAELEQKILAQNTHSWERIENQLHQLTQQLHRNVEIPLQTPSEPEAVTSASNQDIDDPLLSRLSPLFVDF